MTARTNAIESVRQHPGILSQHVDGQLVLLNPHDGQYFALDEIGGRLWELCDGAHTISDVVATIVSEYDAPTSVVETDVRELLHELVDEKLATIER